MNDFTLEETLHFLFTTRAFATGIPTVLSGSPVLSVYENENLTQITAGVTLGVDHDSVVGLNLATIVATAANGYESGKNYAVVITTGTVGGVSVVGEVVASFSIQRSPAFARLGAPAGASVSADIAAIEAQTDDIGAAGAGLTAIPWNAAWDAEVQSEVQDAIEANNLDHIVGSATGIPAVPAGTYLDQIMDDGTAAYDRTTDSLQAIRDRGDAAWITGGGGSISDILSVHAVIPFSIDLADTATVRVGLMLTNALDDLPSTAEITPGTVSIERKAIGGTSWSAVVTDAACSEQAGMVYYDEVFDSGSGYAEGDSIRVTFKSQKITVSANDYEITDASGVMFQTSIRQTMRGTDSAATASSLSTHDGKLDTLTTTVGAAGAGLTEAGGDGDHLIAINLPNQTMDITGNLSGSVGSVTGNVGGIAGTLQTLDALDTAQDTQHAATLTILGTPAGADIAADIAAVKTKVDLLPENPAKNTEFIYVIKMVDSTDHVTPKTGLTVTMTRSIDGASFGAATGSVAEIATGHYKVTASAADMNGDVVAHRFTGTDADDLTIVIQTTA